MFFFLMGIACILGTIMLYLGGIYCLGLIISCAFGLSLWVASVISIVIVSFIVGLFMAYEMKHALQVDDNYEKTAIEDEEDEDDLF